jgi:hypothetical protein
MHNFNTRGVDLLYDLWLGGQINKGRMSLPNPKLNQWRQNA